MAGLCEGGNEPPGSLKATYNLSYNEFNLYSNFHRNRFSHYRVKSELYRVFKEECNSYNNIQPVAGRDLFVQLIKEHNIALFKPKKDECDLCLSYKLHNVSDDDYNAHQLKKERARREKSVDKKEAEEGDGSVVCYFWHEGEGVLDAHVFATCIANFLDTEIKDCDKNKNKIFYSDGCCAQNRNAVVSNVLQHYSVASGTTNMQKYLDYSEIQYYKSIRPGNTVGEPCVTDISALKYTPNVGILYKLNFDNDWKLIPRRPNTIIGSEKQLYTGPIPISTQKYVDLMSLRPVIPRDYHPFYEGLLHK
ncbi:hypothetical protein ANN_25615 [Periplaneta americana]|uniref:Uncharacterized protein n=1 Tax=Periplaneta americana TaxID=6978 RepID=A0ABQ8S200_PERAM|nr:hypothetical protein ANN_25615 [Periplaneta americana]